VSDGTAEGNPLDKPSIAVLPDGVGGEFAQSLARWVRWPDDEYIEAHVARRDRSAEFPATYLQTEHGRGPKLHSGVVSPEIACAEAARWLKAVLRPEWQAGDLQDRLVPLQLDPPSESVIACRYTVGASHIQTVQNQGVMCVVVEAMRVDGRAIPPGDVGPSAFRRFFTEGDRMAALPPDGAPTVADTLNIFTAHKRRSWSDEARTWWWGWVLWYTDGDTVAVFLPKMYGDPFVIDLEAPWF